MQLQTAYLGLCAEVQVTALATVVDLVDLLACQAVVTMAGPRTKSASRLDTRVRPPLCFVGSCPACSDRARLLLQVRLSVSQEDVRTALGDEPLLRSITV